MTDPIPPARRIELPDRFRILHPLGSGGMGDVVLAEDLELERSVAVKILRADLTSNPIAIQRFRREAQVLGDLRHPHLVQLLGMDFDWKTPFLVLEWIPGESLAERLGERSKSFQVLAFPEVLRLARELGDALSLLHARGLVHRDIKPGNVMLREDGGAVLMDLGLVFDAAATTLTRTGSVLGTPLYLPPEALRDAKWGPASDQFQVAALLYLAAYGRRHVKAGSLNELVRHIVAARWEAIPEGHPEVPDRAGAAIWRGLSRLPKDRYAEVRDLAAALEEPSSSPTSEGETATVTEFAVVSSAVPELNQAPESRTRLAWWQSLRLGTWAAVLVAGALGFGLGKGPAAIVREWPAQIHDSGAPVDGGSATLGPGGSLQVTVTRPCTASWESKDGPLRQRLLLPGKVSLHPPPAPDAWKLDWREDGAVGSLEMRPETLAARRAVRLARWDDDFQEALGRWRGGAEEPPGVEHRRRWREYQSWVPLMLRAAARPSEVWRAWERVQRSAAGVRIWGGEAPDLEVPRDQPGAHFEGVAPWPSSDRLEIPFEGIGGDSPRVMLGRRSWWLVHPSFVSDRLTAKELRFQWPEIPAGVDTVSVSIRVRSSRAGFQLRVRPQGGAPFSLWRVERTGGSEHVWLTRVLPISLAPGPKAAVGISCDYLGGAFLSRLAVTGVQVGWSHE